MAADIEKLRIKDERLRRVLEGEEFLVFDGGLGTMIQEAGLGGAANPPDLLNLTNPEAIEGIARAYVEAGSDVITTNTFGSNAKKLAGKASVEEVYAAAARIARTARGFISMKRTKRPTLTVTSRRPCTSPMSSRASRWATPHIM